MIDIIIIIINNNISLVVNGFIRERPGRKETTKGGAVRNYGLW